MSEYRIKAKSADHRKAIIGALEGLGFEYGGDRDNMLYPLVVAVCGSKVNYLTGYAKNHSSFTQTHTSLDSMIEDIIRDRQTEDVEVGEFNVKVSCNGLALRCDKSPFMRMDFADFDRIAEAVAKVRGTK